MSQRPITRAAAQQASPEISSIDVDEDRPTAAVQQVASSSSMLQRAISQTLSSTANLANLLPTGTLSALQLLLPVFTSNSSCDAVMRPMKLFHLLLLAFTCFVASFTDCVKAPNGQVCYGIATRKGIFLFDSSSSAAEVAKADLTKYRMRFIDLVHVVLSALVFGVVALRDKNVVGCIYPTPAHEIQESGGFGHCSHRCWSPLHFALCGFPHYKTWHWLPSLILAALLTIILVSQFLSQLYVWWQRPGRS